MPLGTVVLFATSFLPRESETNRQICRVLEVAYTAAIDSAVRAFPRDIVPSRRRLDLAAFHPEYRKRLSLRASEFDDLVRQQAAYMVDEYRPLCVPRSAPTSHEDSEGHPQETSFTNPIFSSDGSIAVTEISFRDRGHGFGYGVFCVTRRAAEGWSAKCVGSWIT